MTKLFMEANRDPRMGDLYKEYLDKWFEHGGGLFVLYLHIGKPTRHGMWGMKETLYTNDGPAAIKWNAVLEYIGAK